MKSVKIAILFALAGAALGIWIASSLTRGNTASATHPLFVADLPRISDDSPTTIILDASIEGK